MEFYGLMIITPLHWCDATRGLSHLPIRRWSWETPHELDAEFLNERDSWSSGFGPNSADVNSSHQDPDSDQKHGIYDDRLGYEQIYLNPRYPKSWTCQKKIITKGRFLPAIRSSHHGIHGNPSMDIWGNPWGMGWARLEKIGLSIYCR